MNIAISTPKINPTGKITEVGDAEQAAIATLTSIGFGADTDYWIGIKNFAAVIRIEGDRLKVFHTKKNDSGDWVKDAPILAGYQYLWELGKSGADIYILPNKLKNGLTNHHATRFDTVFFEIDPPSGSDIGKELVKNREKIRKIADDYALVPTAQIYSGNKSDHVYFKLTDSIDADRWGNLMRKMAIAIGSDPAIVTLHRKMRFPHIYRVHNGSARYCKTKLSGHEYSPDELEAILDQMIRDRFKVKISYVSSEKFRKYKGLIIDSPSDEKIAELLVEKDRPVESLDFTDFPTRILQAPAIKALRSIPESVKGSNTYTQIYLPMVGGLKAIFGAAIAKDLADQHSPSRSASSESTAKGLNKFTPNSLFSLAKKFGFVWSEQDEAAIAQHYIEKISAFYAEFGEQKALSLKLWETRRQFRSLGCTDKSWLKLCQIVATEKGMQLVAGASPDWWEQYESGMSGLGVWNGEPNPDKSVFGFWVNNINPWLNRLRKIGKRQLSYKPIDSDRQIISLKDLPPYSPENPKYEILINSQKERDEAVLVCAELGYTMAYDIRATGTGKNHELLDTTFKEAIVFLEEHRNPSVKEFRDKFYEVPTRHDGLYLWSNGKFKRTPEYPEQIPTRASNCHLTKEFVEAIAQGKNLEIDSPCNTCKFAETCGHDMTDRPEKSGFLNYRKHALKRPLLRAHLAQFQNIDERFLKERVGIVDESDKQIVTTHNVKVTFESLRQSAAFIRNLDHRQGQKVSRFLDNLEDIYTQNKNQKFGIPHDQIMESLSKYDKESNLKHFLKGALAARKLDGTLDIKAMDDLYWQSELADNTNAYRPLPFEPLSDLVRVWAGNKGSISISSEGVLSITVPDLRIVETLKKFKALLLMDATPNLAKTASQFGIQENAIVTLNAAVPDNSRLTIHSIETSGFGSRNLSPDAIDRANKAIALFKQKDPSTKVIAYKNGLIECDGYWGNHTRGSNDFVGVKTLLLFGAPFPNLNEVQDQYRTMFGSLDRFQDYYHHLTASEIIQAVGRQRAHRFQTDFKIFHFCSGINPSFLEHLGCHVVRLQAAQIDPSLGSLSHRKKYHLMSVCQQMIHTKSKVTQQAIADVLGVTQSAVSQMLTGFYGGWGVFKEKILGDLLSSTKASLYFEETTKDLDDWDGFNEVGAIAVVFELIRFGDWDALKSLLARTSVSKQHWLAGVILNIFSLFPETGDKYV